MSGVVAKGFMSSLPMVKDHLFSSRSIPRIRDEKPQTVRRSFEMPRRLEWESKRRKLVFFFIFAANCTTSKMPVTISDDVGSIIPTLD